MLCEGALVEVHRLRRAAVLTTEEEARPGTSCGALEPPPHGAAFRPGGDFTVGAEDEVLVTYPDVALRADGVEALAEAVDHVLADGATCSTEVFAGQLEFGTPVCREAGSLQESLRRSRAALTADGTCAMAVGVHPELGFGEFRPVRSARYDAIVDQLAGLFRTPTSAFQVHVGLPDEASFVAAYRALRSRLAVFRALAAASPFWHGRDSGLASARAAIMWSYPRVGIPPRFGCYAEYEEVTARMVEAADVPDYTYLWWDLRPQPRYGTLEVRVMDAQPSLARAAGLAALVQGVARAAAEEGTGPEPPDAVLVENDFRAVRYGVDARIVDVDGHVRPLREIAAREVDAARHVLAADGHDEPLDELEALLVELAECDRQRALVRFRGMPALLEDLMERSGSTPHDRTFTGRGA
jgi:carboxylate-amine ligase